MELSLAGRNALICGASAGIGRAAALELARLGAGVALLARDGEALKELAEACANAGAAFADVVIADLDDRPAATVAAEQLLEARGAMHVLINNSAGPAPGPLLEAEEEAFLTAFGRHVLMAQALTRRCLPGMAAAGYGRIINIISTSVYEPIPNLGVSNTIRGAMAGWSKTLSKELPPGVTVNNVLPGFTATGRLASLKASIASKRGCGEDEVEAGWLAQVPEGRLAEPEETAGVIAFLASPAAGYIRGVSLAVDGGRLKGI